MKLENRIALVTGAASGIGRASALALATEGATVIVSDVNTKGGEETTRQLTDTGHEAIFIPCDVSRAVQVESLIRRIVSSYGRLDCAVNNAGVSGDLTPTDLREEAAWDMLMNVNLKGVWLSMKYELAPMLEQSRGSIVNVASAAGLVGFRYGSAYSASKHGVVGLTRSAALEYARKNIRVNAVCPGFTETAMVSEMNVANPKMVEATINAIPMRRLGAPAEIAQAILWLCSDDSSFVTGHAMAVDGGTVVA
ncbi:MAG: glucose 1-dehydrogenase [Anaerolineaceae bacterium]|nr:glucose 1-dehydrogenase [Anaerolineaceae bacterium]